jgi:hypothetical protein
MPDTIEIRLNDAITTRPVEVIQRAEVFGVPVVLHRDHRVYEVWRCTEPSTGVSMATGDTAEAALARVHAIIAERKPPTWTARGYLNLKIAHTRAKIRRARKRA